MGTNGIDDLVDDYCRRRIAELEHELDGTRDTRDRQRIEAQLRRLKTLTPNERAEPEAHLLETVTG